MLTTETAAIFYLWWQFKFKNRWYTSDATLQVQRCMEIHQNEGYFQRYDDPLEPTGPPKYTKWTPYQKPTKTANLYDQFVGWNKEVFRNE